MARFNPFIDQQGVSTGANFMRPGSADTQTGKAIEGFGNALGQLGNAIDKYDNALEAKAAQLEQRNAAIVGGNARISLQLGHQEALQVAKQQATPEGKDFYKNFATGTDDRINKTVDSLDLPPEEKEKLRVQMLQDGAHAKKQALDFQFGQQNKFVMDGLKGQATALGSMVATGTLPPAEARRQADEWAANVEKAGIAGASQVAKRELYAHIGAAELQYKITQDPVGARRQLNEQLYGYPQGMHPLQQKMLDAEDRYNLPRGTLVFANGRENSGIDPNLKNPKSTAFGLFQFLDGDWKETGIAKSADPEAQIEAAARRFNRIRNVLNANGLELTPAAIYGSHLLGQAGYLALADAAKRDPDGNFEQQYAQFGRGKAFNAVRDNGKLMSPDMTNAQVLAAITNYANTGANKTATLVNAPAAARDPNAPIFIDGQEVIGVTRTDAANMLVTAKASVNKIIHQIETGLAKQKASSLDVNPYQRFDREEANKASKAEQIGDRMTQGDSSAWATSEKAARALGFIPEDQAGAVMQGMVSTDPGRKVRSYDLASSVHDADPVMGLAHSSISGDMGKRAKAYNDFVNVGRLPKDQAIARVERMFSEDYKAKEVELKQALQDEMPNRTFAELDAKLKITPGILSRVFQGRQDPTLGIAEIQKGMAEEYQKAFRYHLTDMRGSDAKAVEAATVRAAADVKRMYGVSGIMGPTPYITIYPPEQTLPAIGGSHQYVVNQAMAQANREIQRDRAATGSTVPEIKSPKDAYLVGDTQTGEDARGGRPVSYQLWYKGRDGAFEKAPERFSVNVEQALNVARANPDAIKGPTPDGIFSGNPPPLPPPRGPEDVRTRLDRKRAQDAKDAENGKAFNEGDKYVGSKRARDAQAAQDAQALKEMTGGN